jgi:2-polyprenyl-6-hydroxyphenyl methylase/3-demethylubiquinone-9 3-methyltransferase
MSEYVYRDSECACSAAYLLPILKQLLEGMHPGSIVVDAGCGNGSLLDGLGRPDWEMHGLEISESGLTQARASFPQIQFHRADLTKDLSMLPLIGKCDVVISTEVIEHTFLPRVFAKNCYRLLKPQGTLIVSTPYHGYLKNLALAVSGRSDDHFTALWDYGHIKFWSKRTLTQLLQEAGFQVTQFRGAGRLPYFWKSMVLVSTRP